MKSKHTPGPWKTAEFGIENHERITITSGQKTICNTGDESRLLISLEEARANAHLIAAAPEMLEAAEALLERLNHLSSNAAKHVFHKQFDDLANVIAKARGV